jgi:hypothetical protein
MKRIMNKNTLIMYKSCLKHLLSCDRGTAEKPWILNIIEGRSD